MKKNLILFLSVCFVSQIAEAQELWMIKRYEATLGFGPTFFFGDVGGFSVGENSAGFKDFSFLQTRFNVDLNLKYRVLKNVTARFSFSGGLLKATDERGSNEERGFEASTTFFSPVLLGEYYFIKNKVEDSYGFQNGGKRDANFLNSLDLYFFSGMGGMFYSVSGNEKLESHKNFKSGGFAAVFPVGVGSKFTYSPHFEFGLELSGRYALSDYIDGYTSQYSKYNDVYFYLNFVFIYKIKTGDNGLPSFRMIID